MTSATSTPATDTPAASTGGRTARLPAALTALAARGLSPGTVGGAAYSRWKRRAQRHPVAVDAIAVLLIICFCFSGALLSAPGAPAPSQPSAGATLAGSLAFFGHRRFPRTATVVAIACTITLAAQGYVLTPLVLAPAMALLFLLPVRAGWGPACLLTLAAIVSVSWTALVAQPAAESIGLKLLGPQAWLLLPALAGAAVNSREQYEARARDEEARHRVAEERMRIARELHDVVAHHLALANAQAGTVAHLIGVNPVQAQAMATDMAGTIGSALRELKGTVGLLRDTAAPDVPLGPAPGLARLADLVGSFAVTGLTVETTTTGDPRPLSPAVDLTAYRVIQEALTNVAKHARVRRADVCLSYGDRQMTIKITNPAGPLASSPPASAGPGYGLIGMRERAASVDGRLRAGARPGGGFEVIAELPVEPGAAALGPAAPGPVQPAPGEAR